MSHITNMANSILENTLKKQGMLRWDLSIHHRRWSFGCLSPGVNEHNNLALCQTELCGGALTHVHVIHAYTAAPEESSAFAV